MQNRLEMKVELIGIDLSQLVKTGIQNGLVLYAKHICLISLIVTDDAMQIRLGLWFDKFTIFISAN